MKILMVCLGNICRSAMAEGLMRAKINKYNIVASVDSAGFVPFHVGDTPDHRAVNIMKKYGIDISNLRARLFTKEDFSDFDRIFVMDQKNFNDVNNLATSEDDMRKVDFIMNLLPNHHNTTVPDPYYGGEKEFEQTYKLLDEATESLAKQLIC